MTLYIANCKANKEQLMGRAGRGGEGVERIRDEAVGQRRRHRHAGQLLPSVAPQMLCVDAQINAAQTGRPGRACASLALPLPLPVSVSVPGWATAGQLGQKHKNQSRVAFAEERSEH